MDGRTRVIPLPLPRRPSVQGIVVTKRIIMTNFNLSHHVRQGKRKSTNSYAKASLGQSPARSTSGPSTVNTAPPSALVTLPRKRFHRAMRPLVFGGPRLTDRRRTWDLETGTE